MIDLGAGEPDFPTPACVMDAAHRALDAGCTRYTQVEGIAPLREKIAERASMLRGTTVDPADVVVSTGTKQALFNACFSLFAAGDEVLVPTPGWTSYYQMLALARATPVAVAGGLGSVPTGGSGLGIRVTLSCGVRASVRPVPPR